MFCRCKNINGLPDNYIMEILKQWFSPKTEKIYIGFEDLKYAIRNRDHYIIINTLSTHDQDCLIIGTCSTSTEESIINKMIESSASSIIILYGRNSSDDSVRTKRTQLQSLGFETVYIYGGGLFEWLLLQDVYGFNEFPTTTKCKELLRFRPAQTMPLVTLQTLTYA